MKVCAPFPAGELLIKRRRRRIDARAPVIPCLGYYAPVSPIAFDGSDNSRTPRPIVTVSPVDEDSTHTWHEYGAPPVLPTLEALSSVPPIAHLRSVSKEDPVDFSVLTVHEFLQRSAANSVKKYGSRYRLATLTSSRVASPIAGNAVSSQPGYPLTPRTQSLELPTVSPPRKKKVPRPRRKRRTKSLAQRLLEADAYSRLGSHHRQSEECETTSHRRPLAFHSILNLSSTPVQKRKWSLVDPRQRPAALKSATFGSVDPPDDASTPLPVPPQPQPVTSWNISPFNAPADGVPSKRTKHISASKKIARTQISKDANFAPLAFIPLEEHEDALKQKFPSAALLSRTPKPVDKTPTESSSRGPVPLPLITLALRPIQPPISSPAKPTSRPSPNRVSARIPSQIIPRLAHLPESSYIFDDTPLEASTPQNVPLLKTSLQARPALSSAKTHPSSYVPGLDLFAKSIASSSKPLKSLSSFMDDFLETSRTATRMRQIELGLEGLSDA